MGVVLDVDKAPRGRTSSAPNRPRIRAAIKVLAAKHATDEEFVERFLREVELLAALGHPNIVQVQDFGQLADGSPYLVMERLEGQTVREVASQRAMQGRHVPAQQVLNMANQVCEGLQRAHSSEPPVIHRDLKPDNIFVHTPQGAREAVFKLIDFGIAEHLGASTNRSDQVVGTLRYLPPELMRGGRAGPRADIYSFALVVYEVLTTRFPWDVDLRSVAEVMRAKERLPPRPASSLRAWVPRSVDECLIQALSADPEERQASAYLFCQGLQELKFADDGMLSDDVNTTVPTLATLARARDSEGAVGDAMTESAEDTERTTEPREGNPAVGSETRREKGSGRSSAPIDEGAPPPRHETSEGGTPPEIRAHISEEISVEVVSTAMPIPSGRRQSSVGRWVAIAAASTASIGGVIGMGLHSRAHVGLAETARSSPPAMANPGAPETSDSGTGWTGDPGPKLLQPPSSSGTSAGDVGAAASAPDAGLPNVGVVPLPPASEVAKAREAASANELDAGPVHRATEGSKRTPSSRPATSVDDGADIMTWVLPKHTPSSRSATTVDDGADIMKKR